MGKLTFLPGAQDRREARWSLSAAALRCLFDARGLDYIFSYTPLVYCLFQCFERLVAIVAVYFFLGGGA